MDTKREIPGLVKSFGLGREVFYIVTKPQNEAA